ncbi:hypothetical protein FOXG_18940 [Fusarium oxysporum f. sp. lycopersici 4287]|uniref:Uncharacterized protein n=2 Tax=Fusarium oxysporum TaxID=5507 RepID=A0A0J9UTS1_FUSO4|nr:hypothetical protein FOXG_18940 [Fusarium oxysporum f. sp. lycopersici 4287]EXK38708.1 hypothetical protein FOMG_06254 [Fusarium oxysporum f. sp. melonis 26406]KNB01781.1 hypothetical protein FOXG_18940 [Fusarium oxysporum f. sp. lycopersici 4287]
MSAPPDVCSLSYNAWKRPTLTSIQWSAEMRGWDKLQEDERSPMTHNVKLVITEKLTGE